MSKKFTIRGRTYDLNDASDLVSIQNALVPDNWPGNKPDCVRLFIAIQEMLALQLRRHLAVNFKAISKAAQEDAAEGNPAKIGVSFVFELDQTSPMVAAITKLKMSFSVKHSTEGKPQTYDLTQGELPLETDDMSEVFDTRSLAREKEEAKEGKEDAPPADETTVTMTLVNPEGIKTEVGKLLKKRGRKKAS